MQQLSDRPDSRQVSERPLDGLRILDLTRVVMGPLATQVLADQGADVIVVEAEGGDTSRVMGPGPHPELSGIALNLLRNKRSVEIDLKSVAGRDIMHRLAATCDAMVTTMRPDALERLGADYASIASVAPDIVYCQAQGFPLDGPLANQPAYDDIIQAATGIPDIMERTWGQPSLLPTIFSDKVCGLVIAQAVTAALLRRQRTGRGGHVEVAMVDATTAFTLVEHGAGAICEPPVAFDDAPAVGYSRVLSSERRPHPTKDGTVHLLPYLPKHYAAIFGEAGIEGAESDPRYADQRAALRNSDSLYRDIRAITPQRTTDEWIDCCRRMGIPATPVISLQELVDALPIAQHPITGPYRVIPPMAHFRGCPPEPPRPAPLVGQHTDEVLAELAQLEQAIGE